MSHPDTGNGPVPCPRRCPAQKFPLSNARVRLWRWMGARCADTGDRFYGGVAPTVAGNRVARRSVKVRAATRCSVCPGDSQSDTRDYSIAAVEWHRRSCTRDTGPATRAIFRHTGPEPMVRVSEFSLTVPGGLGSCLNTGRTL